MFSIIRLVPIKSNKIHKLFYYVTRFYSKPRRSNKLSKSNISDNIITQASRYIWIVPLSLAIYTGINEFRNDSNVEKLTMEHLDGIQSCDMPKDSTDLFTLTFPKVKLRGYYEHEKEFLLSQRLNNRISNNDRISPFNRSGYYVLTPFVLEDGRRILVNRGWVSEYRKNPESRLSGQIDGIVEFDAYVMFEEKMDTITSMRTSLFDKFYKYRSETLDNRLDMKKLAEKLQIEPYAIFVADYKSTHKMGPIGGQILLNDDDNYFVKYKKCLSFLLLTFLMYIIF